MSTKQREGLHLRLHAEYGRAGDAMYMLVAALLAVAVSGAAAYLFNRPLLFPSLGPTALLLFERPLTAQSSPRNTLIGHLIGTGAGVGSLAIVGLLDAPSVLETGVSVARIAAAGLSLAATGAILLLLRSQHPPAGATTLLVSLGLFTSGGRILAIVAGVILLIVTSWIINRSLGIPVPTWSADAET